MCACQHRKWYCSPRFLYIFSLEVNAIYDILIHVEFIKKTEVPLMPLHKNPYIDFYRHLGFACVGGFFGAYAILCRCGVMGSAQTMNLLELVINALFGEGSKALLHVIAFAIYILGTMLMVLLPHYCHADMHRLSPIIDGLVAVIIAFFPEDMNVVVGLYPIYFAMSVQWSSFSGARGFYSSTIFSTNNTKQASLSLAEFICDKDKIHLRKTFFYACTLLSFHVGAAWAFFAVKFFAVRGSLLCLPLIAWAYYMVVCEERFEKGKNVA